MNCRTESIECANHEPNEASRKLKPRILVEGPQGSGKSSLTRHLGDTLGYEVSRGFPTSDFIKSAGSQTAICNRAFELIADEKSNIAVFDRSPISQFVWEARNGIDFDSCVLCAEYALRIMSKDGHISLVFIDAEPHSCMERQDQTTELSIDELTVIDEVILYREFYRRMKDLNIPNVDVISVFNDPLTTKDDFLRLAEEKLLSIINKNL